MQHSSRLNRQKVYKLAHALQTAFMTILNNFRKFRKAGFGFSLLALSACQSISNAPAIDIPTMNSSEVVASASDSDWRDIKQENLLYMELENGMVVIELAPEFAPEHVANIKTLVSERYFDGLWVIRSHDNYVAQWGDPNEADAAKPLGSAVTEIAPEWERNWPSSLPVTPLIDGDIYQPDAGYAYGLPVAGDKSKNKIGLAHCYGMVGVGRGNELNSGNGSSLYVVTGHAPRHLDRNVTLVGRVYKGIELLSSLPRGTEALGFYATPEEYTKVYSIRRGTEMPSFKQVHLQQLRTDTIVFENFLKARRYRTEDWFVDPAGRLELCNVTVPLREKPSR